MCLCEAFLLCGFFFFRHDGLAEVRLRCRNATSQGQADTDIAHRHFGPGECAEYHQIVEIPQMSDAEQLARNLGETRT